MWMIFVLLVETLLIFSYHDFVRGDYSPDNGEHDFQLQNRDFSDAYWPETNFEEESNLSRKKNFERPDEIWDAENNDRNDSPNNEKGEKISIAAQLAVRYPLALTLKAILEEMLILVEEDIQETTKAATELTQNSRGNKIDVVKTSQLEEIYENPAINEDLNTNDEWWEGIEDIQRIGNGKKIRVNRVTPIFEKNYQSRPREPINYRIFAKLTKNNPNGILLTDDRGYPLPE